MKELGNDILNYPISVLCKLGLYSKTQGKSVIVVAAIYLLANVFCEIVALLQFINMERNVFEFVANMEALAAFIQIIGKLIVFVYKRKTFAKLIEDSLFFWSTNKCENKVEEKLNSTLSNCMSLQKFFFRIFLLTAGLLFLSSILENSLPIGTWNMKEYIFLFRFTVVLQAIVLSFSGFFLAAFDCLFLVFCIITIVQFKILCYCIRDLKVSSDSKIPEDNYYVKIRLYIRHHIFLIRFLSTLRSVYSVPLIIQYVTSSPLLCIEMYALLEGKSFNILLRHGLAGFSVILQLAFYCIPADLVTNEASAVSMAMYDSDWYSKHISFIRNTVTIVIQKSQQEILFRAGGLVEINARTLITVLRVSWSACTIMRAVKEKI